MLLSYNNSYYIEGLQSNNSKAISEIYRVLYPKVKQYILNNSGTTTDAEDIFQIVIMQTAAKINANRFSTKAPFDLYILKACKFQWLKELKKRNQKSRVTKELGNEYKSSIEFAKDTIDSERYDLFTESIALLSENCKTILQLFFEKKTGKEIMDIMDYSSETTVRQRIFKCKRKLFEIIKGNDLYDQLKA